MPETRQVFLDKAKENNSQIIFAEDKPEVVNSTMTENYTRLYETVGYGTFEGQLAGECQIKNTNTILHVVPLLLKQGLLPQSYNDKKRITALVREAFSEVSSLTGLMGRWQYAGHRPEMCIRDMCKITKICRHLYIFIISKRMDSLVILVLSVAFNLIKLKLQNLIINCKFKSLLVELLMSWAPEAILSLLK